MGVRMNAPYDDGTVKLAVGDEHFDFSPRLEARMIRSGLADALPVESLDHARAQAGMDALVPPTFEDLMPPSLSMTKAELIQIADARGVPYETDDNKADLIRKINEAG